MQNGFRFFRAGSVLRRRAAQKTEPKLSGAPMSMLDVEFAGEVGARRRRHSQPRRPRYIYMRHCWRDGQGLSEVGGYAGGMKKKLRKVTVVKSSPVQQLKAAMAARRRREAEIAALREMLAEKSARQVELETSGDLGEAAVVNEIGKLQVLVGLLPRRIASKEQQDVKAEESLVAATNEFIREHLGPRVRNLEARTRVVVEKELAPHLPEPSALMRAVAGSERVRSIALLDWSVTIKPERGAMAHAEGALKAWEGADEVEKKLLAEECVAANFVRS